MEELIRFNTINSDKESDRQNEANAKLQFLVNRVAECPVFKHSIIIPEMNEFAVEDFLLFYIAHIVAVFKGMPLYVENICQFYPWIRKKEHNIRFASKKTLNKMKKDKGVIALNSYVYGEEAPDDCTIKVFSGIDFDTIQDIANVLLNFESINEN